MKDPINLAARQVHKMISCCNDLMDIEAMELIAIPGFESAYEDDDTLVIYTNLLRVDLQFRRVMVESGLAQFGNLAI